jgi:carbon storage regulator
MLVLSRQRDEVIDIGSNISVEVVEIYGDKVRLGITAPPDIEINRREVSLRKGNAPEPRRLSAKARTKNTDDK